MFSGVGRRLKMAPELLKLARVMNMMQSPSPLSSKVQNDNTFSNRASLVCLVSPLILVGLGYGFHYASHKIPAANQGLATMIFDGVSCLLMFVGLIMGILALLLMKPGGRGKVALCALAGLGFIGWQITVTGPGMLDTLHARARTLAQHDPVENVAAASKDLKEQTGASLKTNTPTPTVKQFSQALDQAAKTSESEDALVRKGSQAYLARIQAIQEAYQTASSNLTAARVLSTSNLTSRETIAERRALVEEFLKCNADLKNFMNGGEDNFRAELVRQNISPSKIESAISDFHKTSAAQVPVISEIHSQGDRIGRGMLTVLDLLDVNWGHWTYNPTDGHVQFESPNLVEQYNAVLKGISEATKERAVAQGQFAQMMSQASMQ
jgi:hypothetical protein